MCQLYRNEILKYANFELVFIPNEIFFGKQIEHISYLYLNRQMPVETRNKYFLKNARV